MTQPNPGDLARIVRDTNGAPSDKSNLGRQVFCHSIHKPVTMTEWDVQQTYGVLMEVEALQPIYSDNPWKKCRELVKAGSRLCMPKCFLERFDPPGDTDSLYRQEPQALTRAQAEGLLFMAALAKGIDDLVNGRNL